MTTDRYWLCDDTCTTDCGACKGGGRPAGSEREQFLRLIENLLDTYRPEGVVIWLKSHNRNLGDTPRRLIAAGEWQVLFAEADRLAGGTR